LGLSGVVLVAWEHKALVAAILPALPVSQGMPPQWDDDRFDVVLRFERLPDGRSFAYRQLSPQL